MMTAFVNLWKELVYSAVYHFTNGNFIDIQKHPISELESPSQMVVFNNVWYTSEYNYDNCITWAGMVVHDLKHCGSTD